VIHFVYPFDPATDRSPWCIGNRAAAGLRQRGHAVKQYDWEEIGAIEPGPEDALLGHPHPSQGRVFSSSLFRRWRRRVALTPWDGTPEATQRITDLLPFLDACLAICGPYWARRFPPEWRCVTAVDMAIDASLRSTRAFRPAGLREAVYVGCCAPQKGTGYLEEISTHLDGPAILHAGPGYIGGRVRNLGLVRDWEQLPAEVLITCGSHDANPTTVLEAARAGMVVLATPTSGWGPDLAIQLPVGDARGAAKVLDYWLTAPALVLSARAATIQHALRRYTWDRFIDAVEGALR
jgi:hypothetical protein